MYGINDSLNRILPNFCIILLAKFTLTLILHFVLAALHAHYIGNCLTVTGFVAALFVPTVAGCSVHKAATNDFHRHLASADCCRIIASY